MAALPQIPVFEQGDYHLWRLQQLSAAVAFACRAPVIFHAYATNNQPLGANFPTAVQWVVQADSDSGFHGVGPTAYVAQTPGYFHVDAGVNCATSAVDGLLRVSLLVTTGGNNPAGPGVVTYIASRSDDMGANTQQESLTLSATTPYLYLFDSISVEVLCSQATTITAGWGSSGNNDLNGFPDGSPSFTGMLVSPGTYGNGTWGP